MELNTLAVLKSALISTC